MSQWPNKLRRYDNHSIHTHAQIKRQTTCSLYAANSQCLRTFAIIFCNNFYFFLLAIFIISAQTIVLQAQNASGYHSDPTWVWPMLVAVPSKQSTIWLTFSIGEHSTAFGAIPQITVN